MSVRRKSSLTFGIPFLVIAATVLSTGCSSLSTVKERITGKAASARYRTHSNGTKASLENFRDGVRDGKQQYFNREGHLYREEEFFGGKPVGEHLYYPDMDEFRGPARNRRRLRFGLGAYAAPLGSLLSAEISQNIFPRLEWAVSGGIPRGEFKKYGGDWGSAWGLMLRTSFPDHKISPLFGLGYSFLVRDPGEDLSLLVRGIFTLDLGIDYQHRRGTFSIGTQVGVAPLVEPYPYVRWSWMFP